MKVRLTCMQCGLEALQAGQPAPESVPSGKFWVESRELNETGRYEAECPKGHPIRVVLQNARHELLFDAAALALLDGYHREAVATFAASLERAFEFFVHAVAWQHKLDREKFANTWAFAKQTERQFGMFLFAHLVLTGEPPGFSKTKYDDMAKRRNEVVHAGAILDREEAVQFGEYVYEVINDLHRTLAKLAGEGKADEVSRILFSAGAGRGFTSAYQGTLVSNIVQGEPVAFEKALAEYARWNCWVDWEERVTLAELAARSGCSPHELLEELSAVLERRKGGPGAGK